MGAPHGPRYFPGVCRRGRAGHSQKGHSKKFDDGSRREGSRQANRRGSQQGGNPQLGASPQYQDRQGLEAKPLADKAIQRNNGRQGQSPQEGESPRAGHAPHESPQVIHVFGVGGHMHRSRPQKEHPLEKGVIHRVQQGGAQPQSPRHGVICGKPQGSGAQKEGDEA